VLSGLSLGSAVVVVARVRRTLGTCRGDNPGGIWRRATRHPFVIALDAPHGRSIQCEGRTVAPSL
jgi:hypothetical protein